MRTPCAALLAAAATVACVAPLARAEGVTAAMRAADPRLETPVRYTTRRACVGEVLLDWKRTTRVDVSADGRDGSTDELVCVSLDGVPLADAMEALRALFSYRDAEWSWVREGRPGKYTYALIRPLAAQRLGESLRRRGYTLLARQADLLIQAAALPEKDRVALLERAGAELLGDDLARMRALAADSGRTLKGIRVFERALAPGARARLLAGGKPVTARVADLGPETAAFVHAEWVMAQWHRRLPDGTRVPNPEPDEITFVVDQTEACLAPSLSLHLGEMGGYAYAGGATLDRAIHLRQRADWMMPGDLTDDARTQLLVPKGQTAPPPHNWPVRCLEFAQALPCPLVARLPPLTDHDPGSALGRPVGDWLTRLAGLSPSVVAKWRQGILLLDDAAWFMREPARVPWAAARRLRAALAANRGLLPMADLFWVAATLTEEQVRSLEPELPALGCCNYYRALFSLCHREPMVWGLLRSPRGLPLTSNRLALLEGTALLDAARARGATALQATIDDTPRDGAPRREVTFSVFAGGQWVPVVGAVFVPPPTPSP